MFRSVASYFLIPLFAMLVIAAAIASVDAQSREVNMPTPIRSDRVEAVIKPRPIGDPRVTTYYFTFDGSQGDIFLNAKVSNFNGDVDVFLAGTLRPLAKMVFYADSGEFETGRVIYLRKPEKLILRVEGRTPNDTDARVELRFAGSFVASQANDAPDDVRLTDRAVEQANSERAVVPEQSTTEAASVQPAQTLPTPAKTTETPASRPTARRTKPTVVVTDSVKPADTKTVPTTDPAPTSRNRTTKTPTKPPTTAAPTPTKPTPIDPMADLRLVIVFKDGTKIDRPMTEILRFGIERSVLTIVAKNGSIGRYDMTTVASVTVQ